MTPPAAPQRKPVDQRVREEITTNVGENLLVEAGAGTGKTTSLVGRIVEILATGHAAVDELAVITFTHKAAAELSARVREGLEKELEEDERDAAEHERLAAAIRGLYRARIETIHAYATALLHERPVEARLDPEFRPLGELEGELLFDRLFGDWLAELLAEPMAEIETAVNLGLGPDELKQAARLVHSHRYLLPLRPFEVEPGDPAEVVEWIEEHADELKGIARRCNNPEHAVLAQIQKALDYGERLRTEGTSPAALARLVARSMPEVKGGGGKQTDWDDVGDCQRWKRVLVKDYQELRERVPTQMRSAALAGVLPLIEDFVRSYEEHRRAEGLADFDDLIIWARDLVRTSAEARGYFRRRFKALLIDEFQDTDPIQVELAMLLASEDEEFEGWRDLDPVAGKIFCVGDPKQSIYRFRRADIGIYDEVKAGPLASGLKELVQNFRSVPGVIGWVNDTFDRLFAEEAGLQPRNVRLEDAGFKQGLDRPPVVVVRGRDPEANTAELREQESAAVAAILHDAVKGAERWPVRDRATGELRDPTWRDVAILLPRRTGLEAYEEALAALGVPYRHEGSRDYFQREEVRDLVFILSAIDDPRDRVSVVGALRSGAFGCSDDDLVIHRAEAGRAAWNYRGKLESGSERVLEAFAFLRQFHYAQGRLSLPLLVQRVVEESRLVEVALTGRDGPQAAANLLAIIDQARTFTAAGGGSPRAFVRWLADNTERERSELDAGIAEETDDVVRIMTMHGAKGLEFPIVVLGGLGGTGKSSSDPVPDEANRRLHFYLGKAEGPSHFPTPGYKERWEAEKRALELEDVRLLYVAATRARDHLVIPDFQAKKPGGLLEKLDPLLPKDEAHEEEAGGVWMLDAKRLEHPPPVEEERRKVKATEAKAALAEREAWQAEREALVKEARKGLELEVASSVKRSVRPLAAEASHSDAAMLVSEGPPLEIGDALHKVMEKVFLPGAEDLEPWAQAVCAEFGIPEHTDEVTELANRCLESPTVKRAIQSGSFMREVPISTCTEKGFTIGRADLVFRDGGDLVVVDYKTDVVDPAKVAPHAAAHHAGQATAYAQALNLSAQAVDRVVLVYCRRGAETDIALA